MAASQGSFFEISRNGNIILVDCQLEQNEWSLEEELARTWNFQRVQVTIAGKMKCCVEYSVHRTEAMFQEWRFGSTVVGHFDCSTCSDCPFSTVFVLERLGVYFGPHFAYVTNSLAIFPESQSAHFWPARKMSVQHWGGALSWPGKW